jgi:hypothetical protein
VNFLGDTCGEKSQKDNKYNAWVTMPSVSPTNNADCADCFYIKTCLADCSLTETDAAMVDQYPTKKFGYFCVPDTDKTVGSVQVEFSFSGQFSNVQQNAARAMGDLYSVWPLILGSAAVALLFAFLYNRLSETFAGLLVTFAIIIITAGGVLASYTLIKAGRDARNSGTATNRSNAQYGLGITLAVLTLIFVLVIIALRDRIRIAIEVVKEANRCVHDIWALIIFPLLPMLVGLGYIVFWVVVTIYIFAVWTTKFEDVPPYIKNSSAYGTTAWKTAWAPAYNLTGSGNYAVRGNIVERTRMH